MTIIERQINDDIETLKRLTDLTTDQLELVRAMLKASYSRGEIDTWGKPMPF